ncbi:hypothetical protein OG369_37760 [Streptomyces sp. NBC_01221]|uniref:hypothetical protein n=1 Tax=Streptomyces sp. NBC_01221 TaxID=2903782 RepID=UPI0022555B2C|nr:hypothetical protein [Streptomyces sp. NBC_01221]MCX4791633.1 hypothetical protein [Streptomyces sp. NBC_01221]
MTDWQDFEWVVWRLEVQDPQQLAGEDPDLDERTQETMTELAASLGCVYELCVDYHSYDDETPYYAWWVRVPTAEHARRGENGLPVAVDRLHRYLAGQLPDLPHWEIVPDQERTVDHAASSAMRGAYDDLITPFERALMPLRRDGADALDPRAKVWKWEKDLLVGTFDLWLCNDPDRPHTWLVVTIGLWTEPQLFDEEPAARLGHFGFTPHHPLLFLPRPPAPSTFTARVESGVFPGKSTSRAKDDDALGTAHQWTANDPVVLAERVTRDLKLLWPHLTGPARRN